MPLFFFFFFPDIKDSSLLVISSMTNVAVYLRICFSAVQLCLLACKIFPSPQDYLLLCHPDYTQCYHCQVPQSIDMVPQNFLDVHREISSSTASFCLDAISLLGVLQQPCYIHRSTRHWVIPTATSAFLMLAFAAYIYVDEWHNHRKPHTCLKSLVCWLHQSFQLDCPLCFVFYAA